jgi:hypothetical protein
MKKLLTLALGLVALAVFTDPSLGKEEQPFARPPSIVPTFSETLVCKRPAKPEQAKERCHGNWAPFDNTNNWKHQPSQGPDHMVRKNGRPGDRSCMKCPNGGTLRQDFLGLEDWCVIAAEDAATATPSCPSGFSWNGNICTRPAKPEQAKERCHGNWAPFDNTNNWKHQPSQGPDHMVRKNGRPGDRSCMRCPNGGTLRQDFQGLEDWCVIPGEDEATATGSCASGFTLEPIAAPSDSTLWLNRDQPGGVGDYETTKDHLKIECRFKATGNAITEGAPVGYHCNIKEGGWCKNNDPAGLKCQDMEVIFSWAGGATPWFNRDLPSGVGDYETIKDLLKVSCRFKATGNAITEGAPVGYHCNIPDGGWCKNDDPAGLRCNDMEVMFSW